MRKKMNRLISVLTAGVLTLSVFAPVTDVAAATKNKVVEIPVNFTNTGWSEEDDWDTTSKTDASLWELGEPSSYSESYTASYKLYIPVSFFKEGSTVHISGALDIIDESEEEGKYVGYSALPSVEIHEDASLTTWDDAQQKDIPIDYATVKKTGDFYVITYKTQSGELQGEEVPGDLATAQKIAVNFSISVKGIHITAKNSAVYVDDIQIAKADGTVLAKKDFTSAKSADGNCVIAPKNNWEKNAKDLKLATITDNKVITVKSTKATVKVGKKVKISATATPATKITYASSNKKVATVDAKGTVTGKKAGKATISVKANGKTVKVAITVKKK